MKTQIYYTVISITMIAMFGVSTLNAQNYTKEQKAVWQEVENKWTNWKSGDLDVAFANIDKDFLGWNDVDPMPVKKEKWVNSMKETLKMRSKVNFDIEPARILVRGNAAVVHYYFSYSFLLTNGQASNNISNKGKWSEFYFKDNGKWMLIGDFTSSNQ
jgi:hypothetical protein